MRKKMLSTGKFITSNKLRSGCIKCKSIKDFIIKDLQRMSNINWDVYNK